MRSRKKELELVTALLEQEHDSVEDLAEAVWKLIDEQRKSRDGYVVMVNHGLPLMMTYGVYDTEAAAFKDMERYRSTTGNEKAFVFKLFNPTALWGGNGLEFR